MIEEFMQKLDRFSKFKKGWNSYNAEPPNNWSIMTAKHFIVICNANNIHFDHIGPSALGGIGITKDNLNEIFVEIYNDTKAILAEIENEEILKLHNFKDESSKTVAQQLFGKLKQLLKPEVTNV